jgi:hypothetical protein
MSTKLKDLIDEVEKLSPRERLALISAISRSLQSSCIEREGKNFWTPQSLETHIAVQQTSVVSDIKALRADFWPAEETADDFIAYIYDQRAEDRQV